MSFGMVVDSFAPAPEFRKAAAKWLIRTTGAVSGPLLDLARRDGRTTRAEVVRYKGIRPTAAALSPKALRAAVDRLVDGRADSVEVELQLGAGVEHAGAIGAHVARDERFPHSLGISVSRGAVGMPTPPWYQSALVDAMVGGALMADGVTGAIDLDWVAFAYEYVLGRALDVSNCSRRRTRVRGYYWGLLLSEGHLGRLGGRDVVLRDAPCIERRDLTAEAGRELVYLQLTSSIDDIPDEATLALRDFLRPVLAGGQPGRGVPGMATWPYRVFEREPIGDPDGDLGPMAHDQPPLVMAFAPAEFDASVSFDDWPDLAMTLVLAQPAAEVQAGVDAVVGAWTTIGMSGGFGGGPIHYVDAVVRDEDDAGNPVLAWHVDMGSADAAAVDVLVSAIRGWAGTNGVAIRRFVIGSAPP
ncbi:MAG TPA: hypothetical protein VF230_05645 [Acidimicrobiales bacterium]